MTFWKGRRVLVTGAGGFIGSHLAERLVQEHASVVAFTHYRSDGSRGWLDSSPYASDMQIIAGDLRDRDSVRAAMKGCEVVMHLAALVGIPYSYNSPASYIATNVDGTLNVLQAAREHGIRRLVHTSSSEVYGTALCCPMNEHHPIYPQSPYAASKAGADALAWSYWRSFDVPAVILRPFNAFGERQSARAIIPTIISQCLKGGLVKLGNTAPTRDLNYVSNTVDAYLLAGSVPKIEGQIINVGSGREVSIGALAEMIAGMVGQPVVCVKGDPARMRPVNSEVDRLLCDNLLAQALLGWTPKVTLEEGLTKTIEWMKEHVGRYRSDVYAV